MKCSKCGQELMAGWISCPWCNTPVPQKKVCTKCGKELAPGWSSCPWCGTMVGATPSLSVNNLGSSASSGILPDDFALDLVAGDIAEAKQRQKAEANAAYQQKLNVARIACIRGQYDRAKAIYEDLLLENPEDINAFVGFLRIESQNYSKFVGDEISNAVRILEDIRISSNLDLTDAECLRYLDKRVFEVKKHELQEKQRQAEEEQRRREEEKRRKEEAARRKLEKLCSECKSTLDGLVNMSAYRTNQQWEILEIIGNSKKAMDSAEMEDGLYAILEQARNQLRLVKTDAQLTQEERAAQAAKAEAERKAKEAAAKAAKEEAERKARLEAERLAREKKRKEEAFRAASTITNGKLVRYRGTETNVVIPDFITAIGTKAFEETAITSVYIPSSVKSIDYDAFAWCQNLSSVTFANGVTEIGDFAFSGCDRITSITLPSSVVRIRFNAFRSCSALNKIIIPYGVQIIESSVFYGCESLLEVTIPSSVKTVGGVFFGSRVKTITAPAGLDLSKAYVPSDCKVIRK